MESSLFDLLKTKQGRVSFVFRDGKKLSGFLSSIDKGTLLLKTANDGVIIIDEELIDNLYQITFLDLSIKNPFAHVGKKVYGDLFVGRKIECRQIWERAIEERQALTQIVGLPRMGKTSIVEECLITKEYDLLKNHKIILVHKEGCEETAISFWKLRIKQICDIIIELPVPKRKQRFVREFRNLDKKVSQISDFDKVHYELCQLLIKLKKNLGYSVLFVFDEFDKFQYKEENTCFSKLHELATSYCTIVTVSRRPIEVIERQVSEKAYFYNLHPHPIYLGVYSKEDIDFYWERCRPYLPLTDEQLDDYKQTVFDYVGGHPCLMDTMNNIAFHKLNNYQNEKNNIKKQLRIKLVSEIKNQMKYVNEQGLEESAKKLLLGSDAFGEDDNATLLQNYSFLNYVPSSKKLQLFDNPVGPFFEDNQMAYVCFSDFATLLFYSLYTKQLSYADKLYNSEMLLRKLVKQYLISSFGSDCFDVLVSSWDDSYEEKWESSMRSKAFSYIHSSNKQASWFKYEKKWEDTLSAAKVSRKNQLNFETISVPNDNRCLIDFASLGQIQHLFLNKDWSWFKTVFGESNMRTWMSSIFEKISKLRNSKDHLQMFYISDSQLEDCTHACDIFIEKVDNYFTP